MRDWDSNQFHVQLSEESIPACNSIECKTGSAADVADDIKRDYFVPNFGMDRDIIDTHVDAGIAAKYCG